MTKLKYKDGDYICLYWEDHPGYRVVKGWHDMEHCQSELAKEYGEDAERVTKVEHKYAFWGVGQDECGEKMQVLYERDEPGRGRFKVTLAHVSGYANEAVA